jgi:hypothetical protein
MLVSSVVAHGFKPLSDQTKDYEISMCCFSVKHAVQGESQGQRLVGSNQDNVSEWGDMFTRELFQ